ncbi:hypothetical protein ACFQ2B_30815 [Streptomyces stramineus]
MVGGLVLRARGGRLSLRIEVRPVAVSLALVLALVLITGLTLTTGDFQLSVGKPSRH